MTYMAWEFGLKLTRAWKLKVSHFLYILKLGSLKKNLIQKFCCQAWFDLSKTQLSLAHLQPYSYVEVLNLIGDGF